MTTFDRDNFERCNSVRIRSGTIVSVAGLKRRQLRKLGYSYSITYKVRKMPSAARWCVAIVVAIPLPIPIPIGGGYIHDSDLWLSEKYASHNVIY